MCFEDIREELDYQYIRITILFEDIRGVKLLVH